jgi:hypothetical protein
LEWRPVDLFDAVFFEQLQGLDELAFGNVPDFKTACPQGRGCNPVRISQTEIDTIDTDSTPDIVFWLTLISYILHIFAERDN